MPRKVFTAGEVLAAADVNEFLMDQAVQSFAGTAARGSAIPTPVTGMTTYLEDTKDLRTYDGSNYISTSGLTLLVNQTITTSTSTNIDNVFTSEFQNYKITIQIDTLSASNQVGVALQLRKAGANLAGANYAYAGLFAGYATGSGVWLNASADAQFGTLLLGGGGSPTTASVDLFSPNVASLRTGMNALVNNNYGSPAPAGVAAFITGVYGVADNIDGLRIFPSSGNMSGNIKIYGYRN
jgi:hypothetical protein